MNSNLPALIENKKAELLSALPALMRKDHERYLAFVTAAISNPAVAACTPESVWTSLVRSAQWGLIPDGVHGALVPYGRDCTFIAMYRGMVSAYRRGGEIRQVWGDVVFKGDQFTYERGLTPKLVHVPDLNGNRVDPDNVTHAYACARWKDGHVDFEVMSKGELDRIKGRARSQSGPWKTDTIAMYLKTPVRRLARFLPLSEEIQQLVSEEERIEAVEHDDVASTPTTLDGLVAQATAAQAQEVQAGAVDAVPVRTLSGLTVVLSAPWDDWKGERIGGANHLLSEIQWQTLLETEDKAMLEQAEKALVGSRAQEAKTGNVTPERNQRLAMTMHLRKQARDMAEIKKEAEAVL